MALQIEKVPLLCSQRFGLAVLGFFGTFFVYAARVNLSVAILCMVRSDVVSNLTSLEQNDLNTSSQIPFVPDDNECGEDLTGGRSSIAGRGEFDWDKPMQNRLLSMYFYGYIFTQIPGGWLASRYGGRRVWGWCMLVSSICSLLTPVAARTHIHFVSALRFILGFSAGVTFPCIHALLGQWAPPYERSKMATCTFGGPLVGLVVTFAVSGIMCEYGFDNGWGSIFYLCGIFNLVWLVLWFFLTADSPAQHKRITQRERDYIENAIGKGIVKDKKRSVPWKEMFMSGPLWALILAHFCHNYTNYTLLTSLPTFMKESLKFDIKQNGLLSALPYVSNFICSIFMGYLADMVNERGWLTVKNERKLFQAISFLGTAVCCCLVVQVDCHRRYIAVVLLCLCTCFLSVNRGAYVVNHLDLAPSYAGILFGITNTAATIPGMIAPTIAGALTPNKTSEEWGNVFYLCAAVLVVGAILYGVMADGELQAWAGDAEIVIEVDAEDQNSCEENTPTIKDSSAAGHPLIEDEGNTNNTKM